MKKVFFIVFVKLFVITTCTKASNEQNVVSNHNITLSDSTEFKDYLGSYKMDENPFAEKMKIVFKDGNIFGQVAGYPALKLTRKKDDEFEESNFGAVIIFSRVNGIVSGVKVSVQGQDLFGTKE
ncbi:hypothetical protein LV89_04128 [Arcicella aurantiaca]|uniref:DUF3471 domain-containing protein n=1 Tax=Arcicella aurantiaca TaxID=591202 RepID=A0A316DMG5_9BACT|nr:hypothetical protein [Arcicella aurantiaca]PWK18429.1 hypothetical protein LV89_04128 [Arcicella aurantiaca]